MSASNEIGTTALLAGDYTYYIRDAQYDPNQPTCQRQAVFTVNHGRQLQLNGELENVSCKGGTDGSIALTVTVANRNANEVQDDSKLSYSWSNTNLSSLPISSSEDLNNLRRGTYTLVARYDINSTFCENSRSFSILEPESTFRISEVRTYTSGCGGGADGRALVSIAGGWSNTLNEYSLDGANWQPVTSNSFILNNLSPGVHEVRVRQHGLCESIETFTIETASLPLSIVSSINPQCPQGSDGSLLVSSIDGDVEYSLDGINYQSATVFSGLPAGSYTIRARRISNPLCQSTSIVVNLIDPVDCGNGVLMLNAGSVTSATCAASVDGSAQVLASGGVPPYRYYWDGSSVAAAALQSLSGGAHSVTVKDAVDATATLAIVVPLQAPLSATVISNPGSCADSCDGSINLLVSGGSGNYTYQWSDNQTTADRMNLCTGRYTVTISDASSTLCTLETTAVVSSQPPIVVTASSIVAPACAGGNDGSINVVATGGSGSYSYSWSNGNTGSVLSAAAGDYTITLTDQVLGCSTTSSFTIPEGSSVGVTTAVSIPSCVGGGDGRIQLSTTSLITPLVQWSTGQIGLQSTGLSAGTYSYTLTDAMGCVQSSSVVVSDPIALQITSTQNNLSCAGQCSGSIALSITGGSAPYQVLWSTGSRSSSLQNLCAGTYSYQVRDNKGCVQTGSVTIQSPAALSIITTPTHPSCYRSSDGSVLASVTGGSGAYTYSWTRLTSTTVLSSTQTLSNVNAGAYRIQIQDERGCQRSATVTLVDPLPLSLVNDKQTMPSCNGLSDGGIEVITSGGTAPYSYSWQDGTSTAQRSNLAAGSYRVEVMDAKGCRLEKTYTLTAPAALSLINVLSSDPNCFGDSNGSISLSASGGSAPYNYSWSNGSTTSSLSNLVSGSYSVVITDSKQCKLSSTFTLTASTQLTINGIDPEYVICTGSKAVISPVDNWSSYSWSGPQSFKSTAARIETGVSGVYQLTTTDTRGCEASRSFSVTVSASALLADFLRISEALVYNPIVLVDISVPLPDKITWLLPEDGDILVNQQAGSMLELVFTRAGAYEVGLKAELGQCSAELYKVIVIEAGNGRTESVDEAEQERLATPLQTLIYPNPAKDELQLNVQAPEREQVMVSLVSAL
ncbi:MAG: SprB repeat-containing protein, partial [Cyclobacteriaceae bacterium]|nr:SprB repeat-containing protein [Cyclobacteriaceae bacterium]